MKGESLRRRPYDGKPLHMSRDLFTRIQGFGRRFNAILEPRAVTQPMAVDEDDLRAGIVVSRRRSYRGGIQGDPQGASRYEGRSMPEQSEDQSEDQSEQSEEQSEDQSERPGRSIRQLPPRDLVGRWRR